MIKRFQIEDLIVQDTSGVVFRALDTETDRTVAVRRFFPFGVDGGGLQAEEQTAYNIAIGRLAGISHSALRSVICGGCDPVDGMPFIATEWVEGKSLETVIKQGPLSPEIAVKLITDALEVCELLSHVLAEEAVWVETGLQTIVRSDEGSGRRFTFWISPLKWLGAGEEPRGLESIITLTEEIMGWKGRAVTDQAGRGLGGWLKWLRRTAATTSLHEAREMLAASVGAEPPASAKRLATRAAQPAAPTKPVQRSKPKTLLFVNIGLILLSAGLGGWFLIHQRARKAALQLPTSELADAESTRIEPLDSLLPETRRAEPAPNEPRLSESARAARANQLASKPAAGTADGDHSVEAQRAQTEKQGGVISWTSRELLLQNEGKPVIVEGVVQEIGPSSSGRTIYLRFGEKTEKNAAKAGIEVGNDSPEAIAGKLKPFLDKKVRIGGTVVVRKNFGNDRPDIMFKDPASIKIAE